MKTQNILKLLLLTIVFFGTTLPAAATIPAPTLTFNATPTSVTMGANSVLTWSTTNTTTCVGAGGWSGNQALSGTFTTPALNSTTIYTLTCTGLDGSAVSQNATITTTSAIVNAGSKMGVNISYINDWGDRQHTFIDVMKQARGFASLSCPWDPVACPVPLDANGWPTTDFGVFFLTPPSDPLGRPLTTTYPSMFGTYKLSFTGQATVRPYNYGQVQNVVYNALTNTTTADLVIRPTDGYVALTFSNTTHGAQNVQLLRPGYALGTGQVFTSEFLNALAPFSTIRTMEALETNSNPATSWATRTLTTAPTQHGSVGIAWEYVIQLATATGKDIWINIPDQVDLNDPSANNYVVQLATLIKNTLNPGIHVYVEYSNELWNGGFTQTHTNTASAVADVNSGADPSLNYDKINNQWYWGYRRVAHQTLKISQLFAGVFGSSAINDTIRPVYMSQYVQPYLTEDSMRYLAANFGAPSKYIYGVGGAPYFSPQTAYSGVNGLFTSLLTGLNTILPGFSGLPAYSGGVDYSAKLKSIANYFGLKTLMYEGGPDLTVNRTDNAIVQSSESDARINQVVQAELASAIGCGADLFMYYKLAAPTSDPFGAYEDLTLPTPKSLALNTVAKTPLSNYNVCTTSIPTLTFGASPSSVTVGSNSVLSWSSTNTTACVGSGGWKGSQALSGTFTTPALNSTTIYTLTCTLPDGSTVSQNTTVTVTSPVVNAGSKMGINIGPINDSSDRQLTFIDIMKQARGFASLNCPWDPVNCPVPLNANGWPTTDFGVFFLTPPGDPLGRSLISTYPSMFGTYKLSFTGKATVRPYNYGLVQNIVYNASSNTTTADVVIRSTDGYVALTFSNTTNGVQNIRLLRPGYSLDTNQVFTSEFLNALAPFSTLRTTEAQLTYGALGASWATRKLASDPTQQDPRGIAWEYIIQLANATGKDIWVNIPEQVDLNDPTADNYVIQLAALIKNTLNPGIHVYVEYSNRILQDSSNMSSAVSDVASGIDPSLNYDNANNQWYWAYRRAAHQTLKISQLFAEVFGPAAINTTIRPVLMSLYSQPYFAEDTLRYLNANFGAPGQYLYGIGGAPYASPSTTYSDMNGLFAALQTGLNSILPAFSGLPAYNGGVVYNGISFKSLANYYGLKTLMYEGGPNLSANNTNAALAESAQSDIRINQVVQAELADAIGCGNDLFMYYKLAAPSNNLFGAYEDLTLPTPKSTALNTVAVTPLSNYNVCTTNTNQLYIQ